MCSTFAGGRSRLLCVALMFPVALLSGILFPIIVSSQVQASVADRMNSTGIATLLNTTWRGDRSVGCNFRPAADPWLPT